MLVFSVTMPSPHPTEYKPSSRAQHISAKRTAEHTHCNVQEPRQAAGVWGSLALHTNVSQWICDQRFTALCSVQLQSTVCAPQLPSVKTSAGRSGREKGCCLQPFFQPWLPSSNTQHFRRCRQACLHLLPSSVAADRLMHWYFISLFSF